MSKLRDGQLTVQNIPDSGECIVCGLIPGIYHSYACPELQEKGICCSRCRTEYVNEEFSYGDYYMSHEVYEL